MPFLIPLVAVASLGGLFMLDSIMDKAKWWLIAGTLLAGLWFVAKGLGWL